MWLIKDMALEPCNAIEIVRDFNRQCLEWHGQSTTLSYFEIMSTKELKLRYTSFRNTGSLEQNVLALPLHRGLA